MARFFASDEVLEVFASKRRDREGRAEVPEAQDEASWPTAIDGNRPDSVVPIGDAADRECGRWLDNRAENAHRPFRRREGAMAKFRDVATLQIFAAAPASIHNLFNQDRHLNRCIFKRNRSIALAEWRELMA